MSVAYGNNLPCLALPAAITSYVSPIFPILVQRSCGDLFWNLYHVECLMFSPGNARIGAIAPAFSLWDFGIGEECPVFDPPGHPFMPLAVSNVFPLQDFNAIKEC